MIRSCTFETAANVCQPRQANNFYAVMAAKRFQTRTEEEIEQLLHTRSSKSTNKATVNAVRTLRDFCKEQNLDETFKELSKTDLNSLLRKFCNNVVSWQPRIVVFWVGRYNKTLNDWSLGKQLILFPLDLYSASPRGTLRVSGKKKAPCFPWGKPLSAYWFLLCSDDSSFARCRDDSNFVLRKLLGSLFLCLFEDLGDSLNITRPSYCLQSLQLYPKSCVEICVYDITMTSPVTSYLTKWLNYLAILRIVTLKLKDWNTLS